MFTLAHPLRVHGPRLDAFAFPEDLALFVVGDVHGRSRALAELLDGLSSLPTHGKQRVLVFLGDMVDRGPDSLGALRLAATAGRAYGFDVVHYLPGNHELMMLDALAWMRDPRHQGATPLLHATPGLGDWLLNGGEQALAEAVPGWGSGDWAGDAAAFEAALPSWNGTPLLRHLAQGPASLVFGDALLVHAGVAPKRPVMETCGLSRRCHLEDPYHQRHWAWIRKPFLQWPFGWPQEGVGAKGDGKPGYLVLHGHTSVAGASAAWLQNPDRLTAGLDKLHSARVCLEGGPMVLGALLTSDGLQLAATDGLG